MTPYEAFSLAWRRVLAAAWWIIWPCVVVLVGRLAFERACVDPYRLLGDWMSTPATAWPVAATYLGAHAWLFAAFIDTLDDRHPLPAGARTRLLLMALVIAIEYLPVSLWRMVGASVGCQG